jgi:hypothetical protein
VWSGRGVGVVVPIIGEGKALKYLTNGVPMRLKSVCLRSIIDAVLYFIPYRNVGQRNGMEQK